MHTKDKLAEALRELALNKMADKAAEGWYHDYLSPLDFPTITLVDDLAAAAARYPDHAGAIMALRERVKAGDFDASKEESDEWAASPEGRETFKRLLKGD
jgi:hypothetical protein